jgi:phosphonate transport system ATP-binding protein
MTAIVNPATFLTSTLQTAAALPQNSFLRVENLSKRYAGGLADVFSDISFAVDKRESIAIIGPNGAGKSTLLKCCVRLLEPDAGHVYAEGQSLMAMNRYELSLFRSGIGFIFQKHQLIPSLSALTNVLHGSLARHTGPRYWLQQLAPADTRQRAMQCLEKVGLQDLAMRPCAKLSGGQSQRVAIARALMQSPGLILADEPTASLDPQAAREVMSLLRELTHQEGIALLFVSHQLQESREFSDRIIGLKNRRLHMDSRSTGVSLNELRDFFCRDPEDVTH